MSRYCAKENKLCEFANNAGTCQLTACTKRSMSSNHNSPFSMHNLSSQKLDDGIYMQIFAVKDGVRYDQKVVNIRELSKILTNSMLDGIEKIITGG